MLGCTAPDVYYFTIIIAIMQVSTLKSMAGCTIIIVLWQYWIWAKVMMLYFVKPIWLPVVETLTALVTSITRMEIEFLESDDKKASIVTEVIV